ncbi:MAG: glycosyltransferase family A protein [Candidatus Methylacidiphilales bacterium]|nr:glycosyltransferase family A protein [Candidatus Methylacidiphilales bacterium]
MNSPLVSILIPCRNAAPWLRACLDSAFAQTWPEKEIILVDDGSTDGSLAIARAYLARGLRLIEGPSRNAAAARNTALHAAKGQWIQFLDADDLLAPDKIERQVRLAAGQPNIRLMSGEWDRFLTNPNEARFRPQPNWKDLDPVEFLSLLFHGGWMMQPGAWLSHRTLLDEAGSWNENITLNDDGEYFARVMLAAGRIYFCPGARIYYRSLPSGSLSSRSDARSLQSLFDATSLIFQNLEKTAGSDTARPIMAAGWKWLAFELYPGAPGLSRRAEDASRALGGSLRPFPAGPTFQALSRLVGWRAAKRIRHLLSNGGRSQIAPPLPCPAPR